jgi:lipopolysaccharide transport system permease protein
MIETSQEANPSNEPTELGRRQRANALTDMVEGLALWRLWFRLGWNDILQKYRRSVLGPFWVTASTAAMVVALGVLYAKLFNERIDDFIPFFCAGLLVWNLIASYLTEGGTLLLHQNLTSNKSVCRFPCMPIDRAGPN